MKSTREKISPPFLLNLSREAQQFINLDSDIYYGKQIIRLKRNEIEMGIIYLNQYGHLERSEFEYRLNRHFIDIPRPKNWTLLTELISVAHFKIHGFPKKKEAK